MTLVERILPFVRHSNTVSFIFFFSPPPRLFGAHLSAFFPGSSGKTLLTGWARGSRVATISHRSGLACWSLQSHEEPLTPLFSFPTTRRVKIYLWGFIMALGQISFFPISLSSFGIVLYCPPPPPQMPTNRVDFKVPLGKSKHSPEVRPRPGDREGPSFLGIPA